MSVKGHRTKPGDTETSRTLQGGTPRNKPGTCPISAQGTQRGQVWPCSSHCAPECCPQVLGVLETCRGPGGDRTSCLLETWRVPRGDTEGGSKCAKGGGWQQGPPPHSQGALCRRWDAPRCPRSGLVWGLRMLTSAGTAGCPPHPTEGQSRGQTWGGEQSTPQSTSAPPQQGFLPGAHTADPRGAEAPAHTQQRAATMGPHPHAVPPRCPCPIPGGATHPPLTQSQNIGRAAINNPARHKAISVPPAGGMRAREKALKYRHGLHRPLCHRWHTVGLIWGPQIPKLSPCGDKEGDEQLSPLAPAHK